MVDHSADLDVGAHAGRAVGVHEDDAPLTRAKPPVELLLARARRRRGPDRPGARPCGRCRAGAVRVVDPEGAVLEVPNLAPAHVGEIRVDVTLAGDPDEHRLAV